MKKIPELLTESELKKFYDKRYQKYKEEKRTEALDRALEMGPFILI